MSRTQRSSEEKHSRRGVLTTVHRERKAIGLSYPLAGLVAVLAVVTGLGQAGILIILVRTATALTAGTEVIGGTIGPLSASGLSTQNLVLIGFALLLVLFLAEFASSWAQASLLANAQRTAQLSMLDAYSAASYEQQSRLHRGDMTQVLLSHTVQAAGLANGIGGGITSLVNFLTLAASALILSPVAGLAVIAGLVVMLGLLRPLVVLTRRLGSRRATTLRGLGSLMTERIELARDVRSFGLDQHVDDAIQNRIGRFAHVNHRIRFVSRMTSASYRIGGYAITLAMIAAIDASNTTSLAALTGSLLMLLRSLSYGQGAQTSYQQMSERLPMLEQLVAEQDRLRGREEHRQGKHPDSEIQNIVLTDVSFAYPDSDPVLHGVNLEIEAGDFVALVGPSGAGKSTLMDLLLRLRESTSGEISVNGIALQELDIAYWRARVAYVPQQPKLQSGTVAESIRFHRQHVSDADVRDAAQLAHIVDEIEAFSDGYDTQVGQLGEELSGGQRQRVALARALAGKPDVLLLDEPTSAVDPTSERLIGETLEKLRGEMIVVVIAHRVTTVERANRVVVLEAGRVQPHRTGDRDALLEFMEGATTEPVVDT